MANVKLSALLKLGLRLFAQSMTKRDLAAPAIAANEWVESLKVSDLFNGAMHEANKRYNDEQSRNIFAHTGYPLKRKGS